MKRPLKKLILSVMIVGFTLICLFPPYIIIISSLQGLDQLFSIPAQFMPHPFHFDNYLKVWFSMSLGRYIINGLIVSFGTIVLSLGISTLAAYPLARLKIPGKKLIMLVLLFTQMFAPAVVLLPLFKIFQKLYLLNTFTSLIIVNATFSLAFTTLLITGFFETVPFEVIEAATIDGCGKIGVLTKILLPISASGILVVTIYIFTQVWNEFLFAMTFIASPKKYTPIVGLFSFVQVPGDQLPQWHFAMAVAVIISVPALILFFMQRNSLSQGLTSGAIK